MTPALPTGAAMLAAFLVTASAAAEIDPVDLYALPRADIVILGEVHDNPVHHAHQAIRGRCVSVGRGSTRVGDRRRLSAGSGSGAGRVPLPSR